jgi:hypothetical protein
VLLAGRIKRYWLRRGVAVRAHSPQPRRVALPPMWGACVFVGCAVMVGSWGELSSSVVAAKGLEGPP